MFLIVVSVVALCVLAGAAWALWQGSKCPFEDF
jgi:hypothetical protein